MLQKIDKEIKIHQILEECHDKILDNLIRLKQNTGYRNILKEMIKRLKHLMILTKRHPFTTIH